MRTVIRPLLGAGPVAFGMSEEDVRRALGDPTREFRRFAFSNDLDWEFAQIGVIISFSGSLCAEIQLDSKSVPEIEGILLLQGSAAADASSLLRLDPESAWLDNSLISRRLGLALFAPEIESHPDYHASGVLVVPEGYYDFLNPGAAAKRP